MFLSEEAALDQVVARLTTAFPTHAPETVEQVVRNVHARFAGRPVRDFVPVLVERAARTQLVTPVPRASAPTAPPREPSPLTRRLAAALV